MAVSALVGGLPELPKTRIGKNQTDAERGARHESFVLQQAEKAAWQAAAKMNLLHGVDVNPDPTWWIIDQTASIAMIEEASTAELKIMAGADFDAWPGRRADQI
jgi:hypothetical protein